MIVYKNESALTYFNEIGHGRYSDVYKASLNNGTIVAAKKLKPIDIWKIKREAHIMSLVSDIPYSIKLYGVFGDETSPIFVTEYVETDLPKSLTYDSFQWIMHSILLALNETHSKGIFHRDIKWQNMLVSLKNKTLKIIDWGLGDFYDPDQSYSPRVGTKSYKAPELLFLSKKYNEKIDIWASGCVMANLMFGTQSFFAAHDNDGVLQRHVRFFGHKRMKKIAKKYKYKKTVPFYHNQSFLEYALPTTRHLFTNQSLDLLDQLLTPEIELRPYASEALENPFFQKS